jgi:hypothetical protein
MGKESDIAKPYKLFAKQRPCADVDSLYKRNDKLSKWVLYINHYGGKGCGANSNDNNKRCIFNYSCAVPLDSEAKSISPQA